MTNDDIGEGLAIAGETLMRDVWNAVDGDPAPLEQVTAALADISRLAPILQERRCRIVR
jgi:hypothetical protein